MIRQIIEEQFTRIEQTSKGIEMKVSFEIAAINRSKFRANLKKENYRTIMF